MTTRPRILSPRLPLRGFVCKAPENPDLQMILYVACESWYHAKCVQVSQKRLIELNLIEFILCIIFLEKGRGVFFY